MFECEECSNTTYVDIGNIDNTGNDEGGKYSEYICSDCLHINKIYDNEK